MSSGIDSQSSNATPCGDFYNKSKGIVFTISAPGKIILHGEHSAVYSKLALAASLGLRTSVTLREYDNFDDNPEIDIRFPDINLHYVFSFKEVQALLGKPLPTRSEIAAFNLECPEQIDHDLHLKNIEGFLCKSEKFQTFSTIQKNALMTFLYLLVAIFGSLNINLTPFNLSLSSRLSLGAGTGSSASFVVCLVASFIHYIKRAVKRSDFSCNLSKHGYAPTKLTANSTTSLIFSEEELRIISDWGYHGEMIHHGTPSGIDNSICTYGSLVAFRKGTEPEKKSIIYPLRVMLINTKISRDTKRLVMKVADFLTRFPAIGNHILQAMDELSKTSLDCIQIFNESDSTDDQIKAAFDKLGELAEVNHGLLRILGVSHPTLEDIIHILKTHGLKGKLTGAGGGGYAICLVPPQYKDSEVDKVMVILRKSGYDAEMTILGDDGVRVDT